VTTSVPPDGNALADWPSAPDLPRLVARQLVVLRPLLQAAACSVALLDAQRQLQFVAASGAGSAAIVGQVIAHDRGIAGWVVSTGQAITVSDISSDERFAGDVAASTGYVPQRITAMPVMGEVGALGVLEVLDADVAHDASSAASAAVAAAAESVADLVMTVAGSAGGSDPAVLAFERLADGDPELARHVGALLAALTGSRERRR
jgi:GAF domain-containing protein